MPTKINQNLLPAALLCAAAISVPALLAGPALATPSSSANAAGGAPATAGTGAAPPQGDSSEATAQQLSAIEGVSLATWFGPGLFGRHTACGQKLTKRLVGVANRTLACGTLVKVAYRGHQLTVPVVDRGPYGPPHANWDLTEAAAQLLGLSETGQIDATIVGRVKNSPELGAPAAHPSKMGTATPQHLSATGGVRAT